MRDHYQVLMGVFVKDLKILLNYKLNLLMMLFSLALYSIVIFLFSESFSFSRVGDSSYTDDLFIYFLTGIILVDVTITCSSTLPLTVSFYQTSGIMEELISDTKKFLIIIIGSTTLPLIISIFKMFIYFIAAFILKSGNFSLGLEILIIVPYIIIYLLFIIGVGLLASSLTIIFKRGNPIIQINNIVTATITGAFLPISQFGELINALNSFLPAKLFLDVIREVVIEGTTSYEILYSTTLQLIFNSLLFVIVGIMVFKRSVDYAKLKNNISNY
jgi:ABC-2 type transport system permease protein